MTSLKLEKFSLEDRLKQSEGRISSLKRYSAKKGESLKRFQQKLGLIRVAMTKEVDKVKKERGVREKEKEREESWKGRGMGE